MTENTHIPQGLQRFIDTTNKGDDAGFVDAFTMDAVLDDWGRVFLGRDGIASWNRTDNIGVQAHFALVDIQPTDHADTVVAVLTVTGNGYNGTGPMTFVFDGDRIARLTIAPNG